MCHTFDNGSSLVKNKLLHNLMRRNEAGEMSVDFDKTNNM